VTDPQSTTQRSPNEIARPESRLEVFVENGTMPDLHPGLPLPTM